ncbi:SusC/RagA family TonB-linked outer membrane protein [Aliifodinibius sp. S!AR15-10]|uniref:SusC/RagA family TonB-linked outer membrane protein n=1 Tax=Aliifodinibius sp. S!AR15-10 TaxID=2950437 RepID=UPI00286321AA|nr:SusC/RagA family TonB-linked outer membrane protein [Aliifodinibius sp. S!AR15-10]MDR8390669.1 SusC/RagA family TonB-linked outer membrane protein [Aliifodinibius sp. S!AR15-10]
MFSSKNYSDSYYYIFFNVVSCLTVTILTVFGVSQALGKTSFQQDLQNANADTITVTGTVTSQEDEKPLPGVSVLIKGTKEGTTTDEKGRYTIEVPANKSTLSFSFLGYKTQEVAIDGKKTINVRLKREVEEMEDVVVVGYGTQRKQDLTGSISSVTANEIQDQNITSADQALQGRVAGVHVTKNSGAPGGGSTVRIRGTNSIRGGNNPLYVIDGMPIGGGSSPSQNPLSLINPQDIASIEVLKDASATAIYGARGANGVVLITTKQGGGNTQVSFEAKYGINQVRKKLDLLNRQEFMSLANEASTNSGGNLVFTQTASEYANTDWQEEVFRRAPRQDYQLSVSGGNEGTRYAISANFLNEKGILIGSDYKRGSFRINFDKQVSNNFSIGNNLVVSQAYYNLIETGGRGLSGIVNGALQIPSVVPVKDQNGNYVYQTAEVPVQRDNRWPRLPRKPTTATGSRAWAMYMPPT